MKFPVIVGACAALLSFAAPAMAQNMTCADYLKADQQMQAAMAGASTGDPKMDAQAAAMDKKMKDYCAKNPTAKLDKAMEEAMK